MRSLFGCRMRWQVGESRANDPAIGSYAALALLTKPVS
jgi:hypothetical protein